MNVVIGDYVGSSSVVINHATSKLVERTTYQPYGAVESDYRPSNVNWPSSKLMPFREPCKFTGKEEDVEVGATYFGARYYQPYLGRFMSADPLTIHGFGSDLNPYAYVGGQVMSAVDPLGLETWKEVPCSGGEQACYDIIEDKPQPAEVRIDETAQPAQQTGPAPELRDPVFERGRPANNKPTGSDPTRTVLVNVKRTPSHTQLTNKHRGEKLVEGVSNITVN